MYKRKRRVIIFLLSLILAGTGVSVRAKAYDFADFIASTCQREPEYKNQYAEYWMNIYTRSGEMNGGAVYLHTFYNYGASVQIYYYVTDKNDKSKGVLYKKGDTEGNSYYAHSEIYGIGGNHHSTRIYMKSYRYQYDETYRHGTAKSEVNCFPTNH